MYRLLTDWKFRGRLLSKFAKRWKHLTGILKKWPNVKRLLIQSEQPNTQRIRILESSVMPVLRSSKFQSTLSKELCKEIFHENSMRRGKFMSTKNITLWSAPFEHVEAWWPCNVLMGENGEPIEWHMFMEIMFLVSVMFLGVVSNVADVVFSTTWFRA